MSAVRIFADFNYGRPDGCFLLSLPCSKRDLDLHAEALADGVRVTLYDTDGLELEAALRFDSDLGVWTASLVE